MTSTKLQPLGWIARFIIILKIAQNRPGYYGVINVITQLREKLYRPTCCKSATYFELVLFMSRRSMFMVKQN